MIKSFKSRRAILLLPFDDFVKESFSFDIICLLGRMVANSLLVFDKIARFSKIDRFVIKEQSLFSYEYDYGMLFIIMRAERLKPVFPDVIKEKQDGGVELCPKYRKEHKFWVMTKTFAKEM